MGNVVNPAEVAKPKEPKPRSFWADYRRREGDPLWHKATDGGYWWGSLVLIERMGKPPKRGEEKRAILTFIERHGSQETLPVPAAYTLEPPRFDHDPATCNFRKVGNDTLLINADYVAHITGKGYRMAQIVGGGPQPVLLYKGELLMGLVLPLLSPEHVARVKAEREGKRP